MDKYQKWKEQIERLALEQMDLQYELEEEQVYHVIDQVIHESSLGFIPLQDKVRLRKEVYNSMRGLDVLTPLLENEDITEIMINGFDNIFVEKHGVVSKITNQFANREKYHNVIQQIVADTNRIVNESSPIVDSRLVDGSRVNVVLSPISLDGSTMTIRKFPKSPYTMEDLMGFGAIDQELADILAILVKCGYNMIVSGGTGSGKTTFLNALSGYIPKEERVITIEDSAELQLKGIENLVRLEVRSANVEGKHGVSMQDLIKASLRMRPDRIVVGEVRGPEALDMLQAMGTGHDGSLSTGHANTAKDMLTRLETMVLMGHDMPIKALRGQIASGVDLILQLSRLRDHSRKLIEIVEVCGCVDGEIETRLLYQFEEEQGHKKVKGRLMKQNELQGVNKLIHGGCYEEYSKLSERREQKLYSERER